MTSPRRIGAPEAKNRGLLLDAAEQLMLEEGYAAVTSRRLASKAGLKPQLVHYYFRTMEELFLEVFRRRAEEGLQIQAAALNSPQPLWALWSFGTDPAFTRISMEFMALANHRKELRAEIAYYAERFRDEQRQAVTAALQRYGVDSRGHAASGVDGSDDQPVAFSGARAVDRGVRWSRRNVRVGREPPAPPRRRAAADRRYTAGLDGSPIPQRAKHALGAVLGYDDDSVHRQITVKPRRAGLRACARHDHRVIVGSRHV